jgi:hypothetical protein
MTVRALAVAIFLLALTSCSSNANQLSGSYGQLYDLSFNSVTIVLQGEHVSIQYLGSGVDPAVLVVDLTNIVNVAGSSIDLAQLVNGQPRGVLQRVGTVTTDLPIQQGTVTFDQVPQVGQTLSGNFYATLSNPAGYTLNGGFNSTVTSP